MKFTKAEIQDAFYAHNKRFFITLERTQSGYIRCWHATDNVTKNFYSEKTRAALSSKLETVLSLELPESKIEALAKEIKMMLRANRRVCKTRGLPAFDCREGYYGEAFGILRALAVLGFGQLGAVNKPGTLNFWFTQLQREVLAEESNPTASSSETA